MLQMIIYVQELKHNNDSKDQGTFSFHKPELLQKNPQVQETWNNRLDYLFIEHKIKKQKYTTFMYVHMYVYHIQHQVGKGNLQDSS